MRIFVVTCITCLILSVAFFAAIYPTRQAIHAQSCVPTVTNSTPMGTTNSSPTPGSILINEILFTSTTQSCPPLVSDSGPNSTQIELYNASDTPLQLLNARLDSGPNSPSFSFASNPIPAKGYIAVVASNNAVFQTTNTTMLRLIVNTIIIDQVVVPMLAPGESYARVPDGSTKWQISSTPTIGSSNVILPPSVATPKAQATSRSSQTATGSNHTTKGRATTTSPAQTLHKQATSIASLEKPQPTIPPLQPKWDVLHTPTRTAEEPVTSETTAMHTTTPSNNPTDMPKKIVLSLLAIAFIAALWRWRRLFFKM